MLQHRNRVLRGLSLFLVCALLLPLQAKPAAAAEIPAAGAVLVQHYTDAAELTCAEETDLADAVFLQEGSGTADYCTPAISTYSARSVSQGLSYQEATDLRSRILRIAASYYGTPYVYGGTYPGGFDCSGFTMYVFRKVGIYLNRCADSQMLYDGTKVAYSDLRPGDLVFFRDPGSPWVATHVGIYVGNGTMIHASSSKGISYAPISSGYWGIRYVGARRLVHADTTQIADLPSLAPESGYTSPGMGLRTIP